MEAKTGKQNTNNLSHVLAKIRIFFTNESVEFGYYGLIGYFSYIYGYLGAVSSSKSITSIHIEAVI